jgi:hypothetical protein
MSTLFLINYIGPVIGFRDDLQKQGRGEELELRAEVLRVQF